MADRKRSKRKTEYVDVKKFFKPLTLILVLLVMAASFVAIKIVSDSVKIRDGGNAIKGDSVLGETVSYLDSDISETFENVDELSSQLSKLEATHTEWTDIEEKPSENGFFCIGKSAEDLRLVYHLEPENLCKKGYSFSDFKYLWVDSVNTSFYALINIPGEEVDLSDYYILVHDDTGNLASRLVINCYEAKVVKIKNAIVTGTLIAPYANIECDRNTSVNGQVYAKGTVGSYGHYREIPYGGYTEIFTVAKEVQFQNSIVRKAAFDWLRTNLSNLYGAYPEDYVLNTVDVSRVTELVLDDSLLIDIGDDLKAFTNLKKLSVKRSKFSSIDVSFLGELVELDISDSEVLNVVFPSGGNLVSFIAERSKITELDCSKLSKLEKLNLSGTVLVTAPDYSKLSSLKDLNISNTGFTGFSEEDASKLQNLVTLNISENPDVTSFDFGAFKNLLNLNISDCGLAELSLENAVKLKTLNCSYNNIVELNIKPAKELTLCEAYGDSFKKIVATGMNVKVGCFEDVAVEK